MTTEEKELLVKDICSRLPYNVTCQFNDSCRVINSQSEPIYDGVLSERSIDLFRNHVGFTIKPYLRQLSSMTEEELIEINSNILGKGQKLEVNGQFFELIFKQDHCYTLYLAGGIMLWLIEYLTSRHFDYNGLIPMGLALEAPKGMYNFKEKI